MKTPPFVIFSAPRCGSTALCRALNLIPGTVVVSQPMFDDVELSPQAVSDRVSVLLSKYSGFKHVFDPIGFPFRNVDWATVEDMERDEELWSELNTAILNYPGLRIVFLQRKNDFERVVSDMVARNTSQWGNMESVVSDAESERYKDHVATMQLPSLDEGVIRWYLANFPRMLRRLRSAVKTNPVLDVWYEDFFGPNFGRKERIAQFRRMEGFLGISAPRSSGATNSPAVRHGRRV